MHRRHGREGHTLLELLIAVLLLAGLATGCIVLLTVQLRQVRSVVSAVEASNATSFASRLLRTELRSLVPAHDVEGIGPDSSRQRVFRGTGIVCAVSGNVAEVRYRGLRDPDPTKDSVLVMHPNGESAFAVLGVQRPAAPTCTAAASEKAVELVTSDTVPAPGILLLFERGTWHLSSSALRYARGLGGRQPITAAVLDDDSTGIAVSGGTDPIAFVLALAARSSGSRPSEGLLRMTRRVGFLNLPFPLDSVFNRP